MLGTGKLEGEWVFSDGDEGCATEIKFTGDNMMTIYTSFGDFTGTIERVENDSYSFDPQMGVIMIELKELENGLLNMKEGG
ncbi:hypothetical protein EDD58_103402 [Hazenella coriacea]|uniref:Uncharacterized protein n=2 Tax=Hazenella coriacea TaxID=1179467 RepID=A0A4V6NZ93_9BACL|nr:hypothetical protein EDD58_103402 [Hazenella coriacea]